MAANVSPIFPLTPNTNSFGALTAANTAKDGTGTVLTVFVAGANGAREDYVKCRALGTNVQTVARFFLNNGSTNATPSNNSLFHECTLPATTLSETSETVDIAVPLNLPIPAGYKINVVLGTAVAAGWQFTGVGGDY